MFDMFSIPLYSMAEIFFFTLSLCVQIAFLSGCFSGTYSCSGNLSQAYYSSVTTCSFLIRILPDDYAGAPLLWSSQSEPADVFLPIKKNKKTVMLGKARVHIALETMPGGNISKQTKNRSVT